MAYIDRKDIKCSKCSATFIPYYKNFKCPSCGQPTNEFYDFVPIMVKELNDYKEMYRSFLPPGWSIKTSTDWISVEIHKIFYLLEKDKPANKKQCIIDYLKDIDWGEKKYLQNHVKEIAFAILDTGKVKFGPPSKMKGIFENDEYYDKTLNNFVKKNELYTGNKETTKQILRELVKKVLNNFSPREQKILKMRFGLEDSITHTIEEISRESGITYVRLYQIEAKAFELIKKKKLHSLFSRKN